MKRGYIFILAMAVFLLAGITVYAENGYIVTVKENSAPFLCGADMLYNAEIEDSYNAERLHEDIYYIENEEMLSQMISDGIIESYEKEQIAYLCDDYSYNDTYFSSQWYWDTMKISETKALMGSGNADVRVGIIDSGISYDHPDLIDTNIEAGYDYTDDTEDATAEYYHGVFVAGIIAAQTNNNEGIAGIADKVTIVPLKCFAGKTTSTRYIISSIYDAVDKYDCDIINMSFGTSKSQQLKNAVNYAVENNVMIVAAVGNDGTTSVTYPAGYDNVIGVGAVAMLEDGSLTKAEYSQYNSSVYISAPGSDIVSTSYTEDDGVRKYVYTKSNGTSFSTPMVTSFLALAKSVYPDMTVSEAFEIVKESAEDRGSDGYDTSYGYGVMNMRKGTEYLFENFLNISLPTEEPTVPTETEEPTETEKPAESEKPTGTQEPTETENPTGTQEPTGTEEPAESEEPTGTQKPAESENPLPTVSSSPIPTLPALTPEPTEEQNRISENVTIYKKEEGNILTLRVDGTYIDESDLLIVTFFDENGVMIGLKISDISLAYNGNIGYNVVGDMYNIMVWDSLESMRPVEYILKEYE